MAVGEIPATVRRWRVLSGHNRDERVFVPLVVPLTTTLCIICGSLLRFKCGHVTVGDRCEGKSTLGDYIIRA